MFEKFDRAVEETGDLDLIPVMNLFMVLIPFLLMGAAFYHIGTIPASLPAHTPQESDVPETPTTVTVNLIVKEDRIDLSTSSVSLGPEVLDELAAAFPNGDGGYDVPAVQAHLKMLKRRYPASNTMIVLPFEGLDYQSLVELLDSTREYEKGEDDAGDPVYEELFPVVVFSRFVPEGTVQSGREGEATGEEEAAE